MSKLLITGSSGFVGKNFIKYAKEKQLGDVGSLNLREPLPYELPAFTTLIHLAGKAHDLKNAADPQEYFDVNYGKTKELFNLFLASEGKDFIYFSSVKAAADTVEGILQEDAVNAPQTPYGKSKLQAEEYILSQALPQGKRVFIFRPCMIHGPGNKGNLNLLYQFVKKGLPYPLAAFDNQRSFLSISNLNFILGQIITNPDIAGDIYNMADDEPLSTNKVIEILSEVSGSKPKLWKISPGFIKTIAAIGDKLHLPLNSERLKKLTESYVVSNEKIKNALNIDSLPVSSKEGLKITIQSFGTK
jgi:nucleoside-diphosphate-sugar epimerase